jgi:hypothetical protein
MTKHSLERGLEIQNSIRDLNDALSKISKIGLFSDSMGCIRSNVFGDLQGIEADAKSSMTLKIMAMIEDLEKEFSNL